MWLKLIALVLVVRWIWFEPFFIPSASMEPTIHGDARFLRGDRVAVNKLAFGPRIPFTNTRIFSTGSPNRWDIVVFNNVDPKSPHKRLIKRVVGMPGERIHIADGKVYANDEPLELPPDMPDVQYTRSLGPTDEQVQEFMQRQGNIPEGLARQQIQMLIDEASPLVYGVRPEPQYSVVPEGHYLLLGDNSPHSLDGRAFGWMPEGNMLGRAFCIWWPVARWRDLTGFTNTWWGLSLLIGIPLLIVLYEVITGFVLFSWRVRHGFGEVLRKDEHVLVNRLPFGVRLPLIGLPLVSPRNANVGEYVLVEPPADAAPMDGPFIARVVAADVIAKVKGRENGLLVAREGAESTPVKVSPDRLLGTVVAVWRPLRNRRTMTPADGA
jgi:signal peptidase I